MNRKSIVVLLLVSAFLCTSCALLPKEEVLPDAPELMVQSKQHTLIPVTRGDIALILNESCTYEAGVQEELYFSLAQEPIGRIYVHKGDVVTAGTLVAELESSAIVEQIAVEEEVLASLAVQIAQTEERLGLYYEKCSALETAAAADPMYSYQLESAQRTCLRLYNDLEFLKKDQAVEQMALDALETQLKQRQVFAGMDGTVSYAMELQKDRVNQSFKSQCICRISDMNTSRFVAKVATGTLKKGDPVTVIYDDLEHAATISSVTLNENNKNIDIVEIALEVPDETITSNMKGQLITTLEEHKDVLLLPQSSVDKLDDGKTLVYYLNENGVRHSKEVEIGLETAEMVEIVSGLEEGEMVIK